MQAAQEKNLSHKNLVEALLQKAKKENLQEAQSEIMQRQGQEEKMQVEEKEGMQECCWLEAVETKVVAEV